MPTDCIHNRPNHNLPWANWNNKQQRKNVSTQVTTNSKYSDRVDADWGKDRRAARSGCLKGRKTYRVFTNYSRARKRMDGEDVNGSKIKVQFSIQGQDSDVNSSQNFYSGKKGNIASRTLLMQRCFSARVSSKFFSQPSYICW